MLQDGMMGPRPCSIVVSMSSSPWMAGWPCHGPPHTVLRFGVARTSYGSSTVAGFATMPPSSVGPWHCTHPTPPWFSSVNSSTAWRPRSIACSVSASSWLRFASGSKSHVAGTQTTRNTTSRTPQPWSFCSSGVSRSGSDGPGRMVRGISIPSRGRRDRASSTAPATARKTAPPKAITIPWACVSASVASTPCNSYRSYAERPGLRPAKRVGAARRTDDDLRGVDEDVACRGHLDAEPIEPARRRTEPVLARGVVLRAVAGALEPLGLTTEGNTTAKVHTPLVQRHDPLRRELLRLVVDVVGRAPVVGDDVEAPSPRVERLAVLTDERADVLELAGIDPRAEPPAKVRPQERQARSPELRSVDQERCDERAPEELTPADRLRPLGNPSPQGGCRRRRLTLALIPTRSQERESEDDREQVDDGDDDDRRDRPARDGEDGRHSSKNAPCAHGHTQL